MKNKLFIGAAAVGLLVSMTFAQEQTAEDLFNFATIGRIMQTNRSVSRAKEISEYVAGIDEKNISYEYMLAIKKENVSRAWFYASSVFIGAGVGSMVWAFDIEDKSIKNAAIASSAVYYGLGAIGISISSSAMQKASLRKDMLIRRIPISLKQVTVSGNGVGTTWEFGKNN